MDKATKILVVDNDLDFVKLVRNTLGDSAYQVIIASDRKSGLEKARRESVDMVIVGALEPRGDALGSIERVALSFGLSIAVVPLIGLVLNYTPWGITLYPVLISVTTFILTTSMVAWYRRRRLPEVERFTVSLNLSLAF